MKDLLCLFLLLSILSLSACGKKNDPVEYEIAYSSDISGNPEIYLTDITGNHTKKITDYEQRDGYPAWSPDGSRLAFYAYHGRKTWSIHTMNTDGTERKRLTSSENRWDNSPAWSPDGKKIVFAREYVDTLEIWIMNADGSDLRRIEGVEGGGPSFTHDGRILFHSKYGDSEICISDGDGGNVVRLTDNDAEDWHPEISPDGSRILFMSDRDGNYELYVMNIDGSGQERVTDHPAGDWDPCWSPDGSRILFTSERDGDFDIYIMQADGSLVRNITNNDAKDIQPAWRKTGEP